MNLTTERSGESDATLAMLERIYRHLVGTFPLGESLSNDVEAFHAFTAEYAELQSTVERLTRERDEAEQDTKRLDWLDAHGTGSGDSGDSRVEYALTTRTTRRAGTEPRAHPRIREVVDAARRAARSSDREPT